VSAALVVTRFHAIVQALHRSDQKEIEMTERFSGLSLRNFAKLELKVVKLSLQKKIYLEF